MQNPIWLVYIYINVIMTIILCSSLLYVDPDIGESIIIVGNVVAEQVIIIS